MQKEVIANVLMLGFFYLHYFILIPRLYFNKRRLLYVLSVLAGFLVICLLPAALTGRNALQPATPGLPGLPPPLQGSTFVAAIRHHISLFIAVVSGSLLLRVRNRWYLAEQAHYAAEMANLHAQINPHFLFNTLNSIYALAVRKDDDTPDAIVHLSGLMRYVTGDARQPAIPVQDELEYIRHYIALQRFRLGNTTIIHSTVQQQEPAPASIAPLILITFIENAFKHGVNPEAASAISVHLNLYKKTLHLSVHNYKVALPQQVLSSGIGVRNARERLELLYPGKHLLEISQDAHHYLVKLRLDLL
jgi:LytS/YehU family sensor histidine kinase